MRLLSASTLVAEFGWYLLFPGYFFYHVLLAAGVMPPFAGGLFGPGTFVLAMLFMPATAAIVARYRRGAEGLLVAVGLFLFYCVAWLGIQHYTAAPPYRAEAALQVITFLCSAYTLFLIGANLVPEERRFKIFLALSSFAVAILVVGLFDTERLLFYPRELFESDDEGSSTYQGYARSALIVSLFLLAQCTRFISKMSLAFVTTIVLFLLGARSELFSYVGLIGVVLVIDSWRSPKRLLALAFALILASGLVVRHIESLEASRQLQVLNLAGASSWILREQYLDVALRQVLEHPVIGVHAGHFEAGGVGSYAHNAVSAWVSFGLMGFVLYVGLTAYSTGLSIYGYWRSGGAPSPWRLAFYVNLVCMILVIAAKPVFWAIPPLGWGLAVNALCRARAQRARVRQ